MIGPCERPLCDTLALHHPHIGGVTIPGWEHLCCEHADLFMRGCAATVGTAQAAAGWARWCDVHAASCGELVPG